MQRNLRTVMASAGQNVIAPIASTSAASKIGKLIEDLRNKVTRKGIVLLLLEIAERPEVCIDYDISLISYLQMFFDSGDEDILSDIGQLIFSATKIYSRRVDDFHDTTQNILTRMNKCTNTIEDKTKTKAVRQRRSMKRSKNSMDAVYEADMCPKQLKISKTIEDSNYSAKSFEPPENFFKNWAKYKEWRTLQKNRVKGAAVFDDSVNLHPALWNISSIEDFDYDDDIDTKRNYRVFTSYIEHREGGLVNDIDFNMHFKVKDFIEAENDEHDIMNILGLPPPPRRTWPLICPDTENEQDYTDKYVGLEDLILRKRSEPSSSKEMAPEIRDKYKQLLRERTQSQSSASHPTDKNSSDRDGGDQSNVKSSVLTHQTDQLEESRNEATTLSSGTSNAESATVSQKDETSAFFSGESLVNQRSEVNATDPTIQADSGLSLSNVTGTENNSVKQHGEINCTDSMTETSVLQGTEEDITQERTFTVNSTYDESAGDDICENEETMNDKSSGTLPAQGGEDESITKLDEIIQHAMMNPVVELIDILKPIISVESDPTSLVFNTNDDDLLGFLDLDKSFFECEPNSGLTEELLSHTLIRRNILKIPNKILEKKKAFRLPPEYDIYKSARKQRKTNNNTEIPERRKFTSLKISEKKIELDATFPSSPITSEEFVGFHDDEIDQLPPEMLLFKSRMSSRDSGIGTDNNIAFTTEATQDISQVDNTLNVSQIENPILHSTAIGDLNLPEDIVQDQIVNEAEEDMIDTAIGDDDDDFEPYALQDRSKLAADVLQIMDRVQKWHRYLKPILRKSKERHHFDIFNLGTDIINTFSADAIESKESISLEDVMKGKDPSLISRYMLSMLLLVNQNNIALDIDQNKPHEATPNNFVKMKLLSKKRHTVSVEDDIGAKYLKRRRIESPKIYRISNETNFEDNEDSEQIEANCLLKKNEEKIDGMLKQYKTSNRELLTKTVQEHRDDYIRDLSRKHGLDVGLYLPPAENGGDRSMHAGTSTANECIVSTQNMNMRGNSSQVNRSDDADSGFHSHNATEATAPTD